jgi:hypothetical protein
LSTLLPYLRRPVFYFLLFLQTSVLRKNSFGYNLYMPKII